MERSTASHPIRTTVFVLVTAAALAACSDATIPTTNTLSADDAEGVAAYMTGISAFDGVSLDAAPASVGKPAVTRKVSFTITLDCPAGGESIFVGNHVIVVDRNAGTASAEMEASHTLDACTFARGDHSLTLDGEVAWLATAAWVLRESGGGRDLVAFNGSKNGSVTITRDGESRVCEIHLTRTYADDANTMTIDGTVCGREVHIVRGRRPQEG